MYKCTPSPSPTPASMRYIPPSFLHLFRLSFQPRAVMLSAIVIVICQHFREEKGGGVSFDSTLTDPPPVGKQLPYPATNERRLSGYAFPLMLSVPRTYNDANKQPPVPSVGVHTSFKISSPGFA